jgi:hypothetical protein
MEAWAVRGEVSILRHCGIGLVEGDVMTIRGILKQGVIQPTDPLPPEWSDGQELVIEGPAISDEAAVDEWSRELQSATAQIPAEEHDRFIRALDEIERESKDAVRRERGLK